MPNGPSRKEPGLAVEQVAEDARRVEARNAEPVDRSVGRDQGAGVAVGEEGVVGDRRKRRGRGCALLRGGSRRSRRDPGLVPAAVAGDQLLGRLGPPGALRVGVHRRRCVEQRLQNPPGLLDAVLTGEARAVTPSIAACSRTSYGVGPSPPSSANSMSRLICSGAAAPLRWASTSSLTPVLGSSFITSWSASGRRGKKPSRGGA